MMTNAEARRTRQAASIGFVPARAGASAQAIEDEEYERLRDDELTDEHLRLLGGMRVFVVLKDPIEDWDDIRD